ncbi:Phosphate-selective porin O and P [Planctomycetes bacterium CA13]|uniref:Phosphate-selective porin O and P n=1 Tax=Novipirellula herctigrandis TaxID=2527986 RepID=A0A5C5ZAW8_9BACT|nr:Phosphate-selective porin O and P [Planctomycetes bacterium CA13]
MLLAAIKRTTAALRYAIYFLAIVVCNQSGWSQTRDDLWLQSNPFEDQVNRHELGEFFAVQRRFPDPVVVETTAIPSANSQVPLMGRVDSVDPSPSTAVVAMQLPVRVGYDGGFTIASQRDLDLGAEAFPYWFRINGYGQIRDTIFDSRNENPSLNQLQLKRARILMQGHAFSSDIKYFVQLDGRSNSGDNLRILDYYLQFDLSHQVMNLAPGRFGIKAGLYKMPFSMARELSGKQFEFADRSMASLYFDVNRSLAWGLYGSTTGLYRPIYWDVALFNGLVTGGEETGSSGTIDNNNAVSFTAFFYPTGNWGQSELADFEIHQTLATRIGAGAAFSTINRIGVTEFNSIRVVDSGRQLSSLLPPSVDEYSVALYSIHGSMKYQGLSSTIEYYFRSINHFKGASIPDLFDHGMWLQLGYFAIQDKLQILARWSSVSGNSGTLGQENQNANEIAGGAVWYFRGQHVKLTVDATYLDGAPISSSALDIAPGDEGWLYRTQLQFSF